MSANYGESAHPQCNPEDGHTCALPSGKVCVVPECGAEAGTRWGPHWCPDHDAERIDRVSRQFDELFDGQV